MRKSLSLLRLYKMANEWMLKPTTLREQKQRFKLITDFLRYVNENKNRTDL